MPGGTEVLCAAVIRALCEDSILLPRSLPLKQSRAKHLRRNDGYSPGCPREIFLCERIVSSSCLFGEGRLVTCGLAEHAENDSRRERFVNGAKSDSS